MVHLSLIKENVMSPSKSTRRDSHLPFFVWTNCPSKWFLARISLRHITLAHFGMQMMWCPLHRNGMPFAETLPTHDINALVFCMESSVILPYSNGYIRCKLPKAKGKPYIGKSCVFEPSFKYGSQYSQCDTYEGLGIVDDTIASLRCV